MKEEMHQATTLGHTLSAYGALTWLWVMALSMAGGAASFFRKLRAGDAKPFNLVELIGELVVSAFAGMCTFMLCEAANFSPLLNASLTAIAGHMGSRAIFLLEKVLERRLNTQ